MKQACRAPVFSTVARSRMRRLTEIKIDKRAKGCPNVLKENREDKRRNFVSLLVKPLARHCRKLLASRNSCRVSGSAATVASSTACGSDCANWLCARPWTSLPWHEVCDTSVRHPTSLRVPGSRRASASSAVGRTRHFRRQLGSAGRSRLCFAVRQRQRGVRLYAVAGSYAGPLFACHANRARHDFHRSDYRPTLQRQTPTEG